MLSQYSLLYAHNSSFGVIKKKKKNYRFYTSLGINEIKIKKCRTKRKRKNIRKKDNWKNTERKEMRSTNFRWRMNEIMGEDKMRSRKRGRREGKTCEKKTRGWESNARSSTDHAVLQLFVSFVMALYTVLTV